MRSVQSWIFKNLQTLSLCVSVFSLSFILWAQFSILTYFMPPFLAIIIIAGGIYQMLRLISRAMVFPGSFYLIRRSKEMSYCEYIARKSNSTLKILSDIVDCLLASNNQSDRACAQVNWNVTEVLHTNIDCIRKTFEGMKANLNGGQFTPAQSYLFKEINTLLQYADGITFDLSPNQKTFKDLLKNHPQQLESIIRNRKVSPNQEQLIRNLKNTICNLMKTYQEIVEEGSTNAPLKDRILRWFSESTVGSLEYLRCELEHCFDIDKFKVHSFDSTHVECTLILGKSTQIALNNRIKELPTLIYCNPNAGVYETLFFDSNWINFYTNQGINLLLWNYRGFGDAMGSPSPQVC